MTGRPRRIASYLLMALGLLAIMATSPPESTTESARYEGRARLSPTTPEVRIPFDVDVSDAALDNGGFTLDIHYPTSWSGVAPDAVRRGPDVFVEWGGGAVRADALDAPAYLLQCGLECVGEGELVLRWPAEVARGEATVSWSIQARVEFDSSEPPDDSHVELVASTPEDHGVVASAQRLGLNPGQPALRSVFTISSTGALASGDLVIERLGEAFGRGPEVVVAIDGAVLPEWNWVPLTLPAECESGSCEFEVETLVTPGAGLADAYKAFELRIVSLGSPVAVSVASEAVAAQAGASSADEFAVARDRPAAFTSSVDFAYTGGGVTQPALAIDPKIISVVGLDESESIVLRLAGSDDVLHRFGANFDHQPSPVAAPVSCVEGSCRFTAEFELVVSGEPAGAEVVAEIDVAVRVYGETVIGNAVQLELTDAP